MKNIIQYLFLSTLIFMQACDDFLERPPISTMATGNGYKIAPDAEAALIGCYDVLQAEYFIWDNILLSDVRADNSFAGSLDDVDIDEYEKIKISDNNIRIFSNWRDLYNGIARCNILINKISDITGLAAERKTQITGEARFLRSLFYFNLVKLYGEIPLVKVTDSSEPGKIQLPKSTQTELYQFIVEDLEYAAANLPDKYDSDDNINKARATKGAAHALLAKVWAQRQDRDYNKVLSYCDKIVNSPAGYALVDDYTQLFDGSNYNNRESILEIQFIADSPEGNWGPQLLLPPSISGDDWRKYGTPANDLVKAFDDENDMIRKDASIIWEDVEWVDEHWNTESSPGPVPFIFKFQHANSWSSGDHIYLLRLADILLLKAEAHFKLSQHDMAREIVNNIRARVQLPPTTASDLQLLDAILLERRLELAFEAHRWDDLVRNNKVVEVMNSVKETNLLTNELINYNISESDILLPIPANEKDRNPNLKNN